MTLDEISDYKFLSKIYKMFPKDGVVDILEAYRYLEKNPKVSSLNKMVVQKDLDNDTKKRISNFYKKNHKIILNLKKKIY